MIMHRARRRFRETGDRVELAVRHYSLVKQYMAPRWKTPLAAWHLWRAAVHAKLATWSLIEGDQVDVVSRILFKAPRWLGGNRDLARALLESELSPLRSAPRTQPHTRALMYITLGEIMLDMKYLAEGKAHFSEARAMEPFISDDKQRCAVLIALGNFYLEHDHDVDGMEFLERAIPLAVNHAPDQVPEIRGSLARNSIRSERKLVTHNTW